MSAIYSIKSSSSGGAVMDKVWDHGTTFAKGYTSMIPVRIGKRVILFAYNKETQKTDAYELSGSAPWIQKVDSQVDMSGNRWESLCTFVLGNNHHIMAYEPKNGTFGFYQIAQDLSSSKPYIFSNSRASPTNEFTSVAALTAFGQQYFFGYSYETGKVAIFSLTVKTTSAPNVPPLRAENVWYHQWSPGWTHYAFFQLGGCNFFFKINRKRLNVNIDHIIDNPAAGVIPIGAHLETELPDAETISAAAAIPWDDGEPYLLAYTGASGIANVYRIGADCRGFTKMGDAAAPKGASIVVPYRIGDAAYAMFYGEGP